MKAALLYKADDVRIEETAEPGAPGPGEILLRVALVGLCGTDAHHSHTPTRLPKREGPIILGHEVVGTVVAIGSAVRRIQVGQRVVPGCGMWCGRCPACLTGRTNLCDSSFLYGIQEHGGLAEYALFPAKMCFPVSGGCPDETAVLAQPLAIALHALRQGTIAPGETVAIIGIGGIGALLLLSLRMQQPDANVIVIDIDQHRLDTSETVGVSFCINSLVRDPAREIQRITEGKGVDVVIDASGHPQALAQALSFLKNGGRVLQVGIPSTPSMLSVAEMVLHEKRIIPSNGMVCQVDLPEAIHVLATTDLASYLSSEIIALEDVKDGLLAIREHRTRKKLLVRVAETHPHENVSEEATRKAWI